MLITVMMMGTILIEIPPIDNKPSGIFKSLKMKNEPPGREDVVDKS